MNSLLTTTEAANKGEAMGDPIAAYYARHDQDARQLQAELERAIARQADRREIERIKAELEMARYVGD